MKYDEYKEQIIANVYDEADFNTYLAAIENDDSLSDLQYENLRHFLINIYYERQQDEESSWNFNLLFTILALFRLQSVLAMYFPSVLDFFEK